MKIVNLCSNDDLCKSAQTLRKKISDDEYYPDLVVGIPTGGEIVLNYMYSSDEIDMLLLKKQRGSTRVKEKVKVSSILIRLPNVAKDFLRQIDHFLHRISFALRKAKGKLTIDNLEISDDKVELIRNSERVLVVDDAVDSGVTMLSVYNSIKSINPTCIIKTCCINTTFPNPEIKPDYVLYNNVLVRYPWAMDAACRNE